MSGNGLGAELGPAEVEAFAARVTQTNARRIEYGEPAVPLCIWGTHGIGKTALVESMARDKGWRFAYAAPAQFEEMGDLHGLPVIDGASTTFAPPDWVPVDQGPGILLLDDLNRADDRILRGLMQLLQRGELVSWSLPPGWQIIATANPEGADYSVTPMDDAMLTRMLHVTMAFDPTDWARWATAAGVDERGIAFVLTYPEIVTGVRTTPRSLTQFFTQIEHIEDLTADWDLVRSLALSALDEATAVAFMAFVSDGLTSLLAPEEILGARSFAPIAKRVSELAHDDSGLRLDRLNTVCVRLFLHLTSPEYTPAKTHARNVVAFLKHESLPNDLRVMLHRDLIRDGGAEVVAMMRDKELAQVALAGM